MTTARVYNVARETLRTNSASTAQTFNIARETLRDNGLPLPRVFNLVREILRANAVNPCARTGQRTPFLFIPNANPGDIIVIDPSGNPTPTPPPASGQFVLVVTNGFNVEIPNFDEDGIRVASFILDPAGPLAVGTLKMPSAPTHKWLLSISSTQTITSLTLNPNTGQTISNAVTTLAAGVPVRYQINLKYSPDRWFPA
jgi:hypothetical protein